MKLVYIVSALSTSVALLFGIAATKTPTQVVLNRTVPVQESPSVVPSQDLRIAEKTIEVLKPNPARVITIFQMIEESSIMPAVNKLKDLGDSDEPIYILLDSPGGSVLDGATLISQMEATRAPIYTVCVKLCASMAAVIHQYGTKRYMLDRAILMFHPASGGARGQVPNMISQLNTLTRYVAKSDAYIMNRAGIPKAEYKALIAYELWIDGEDAVAKHLADKLVALNYKYEYNPSFKLDEKRKEKQKPQVDTGVFTDLQNRL